MSSQPEREELTQHVASIPLIELGPNDPLLSEVDSQAMVFDLEAFRSSALTRNKIVAAEVMSEVVVDLESVDNGDRYNVTKEQLESVISRATRRGATQLAADIGTVMKKAEILEIMLKPHLEE